MRSIALKHPRKTPQAEFIAVARLDGSFGIRGELKCTPSNLGEPFLHAGRQFALDSTGARTIVCLETRRHHGRWVIRIEGVDTVNAAQALVGASLYVQRADIALEDDEFLDEELIGMRLLDEAGRELGVVRDVEHLPAHDYLVVEPGRALVPLIAAFVRGVDRAQRTIVLSVPPGLLNPAAAEEA